MDPRCEAQIFCFRSWHLYMRSLPLYLICLPLSLPLSRAIRASHDKREEEEEKSQCAQVCTPGKGLATSKRKKAARSPKDLADKWSGSKTKSTNFKKGTKQAMGIQTRTPATRTNIISAVTD